MKPPAGFSPEARPDEVFIGNVTLPFDKPDLKHIPSLRLGEQAYDIHGDPLPRETYRPMMIQRGRDLDLYNKAYQARLDAIDRQYPRRR